MTEARALARGEDEKLDLWNSIPFFAAHAVAIVAPFFLPFSWKLVGLAVLLYYARMAGTTIGYHRYASHRGFKTSRVFQFVFAFWAQTSAQKGMLWWAAHHRNHHKYSDQPEDPHSPQRGFWWSHLGWIVCKFDFDVREMEARYAPEMVADPVHRVLNRIHVLPNILLGLALYAWGGWSFVVWGIFLRLVVVLHGTWFVNSAAHTFGYRTYDTPEGSTNCWWVGLVAWGEGWHNNHHAFQRSARHGHQWWEVDATWAVISGLKAMGLATDVQLLPKGADRFRLDRETADRGAALTTVDLERATAEPAA